MSTVDRSTEPDAVFVERLASWESAQVVDVAADVAEDAVVERVARAIADADGRDFDYLADRGDPLAGTFRDMARAAVAAMPPADEALRERLRTLLDERENCWPDFSPAGDPLPAAVPAAVVREILGGSR